MEGKSWSGRIIYRDYAILECRSKWKPGRLFYVARDQEEWKRIVHTVTAGNQAGYDI